MAFGSCARTLSKRQRRLTQQISELLDDTATSQAIRDQIEKVVERNQVSDALFVLQRHAAPPDRNADFHAFAAALYQRLGRHKEAIEQYQAALRIAPSAGVWWLGLGISYQAFEQPREALDAYQRAKSTGNLAPGPLAFVDQRLKQLQ